MSAGLTCKFWGVRAGIPAPLDGPEYRRRVAEVLSEAQKTWTANPKLSPAGVIEALPKESTTLLGGETACLELRYGDEQLIVDLGTGARRLGYDLMVRQQSGELSVLFTHTTWDRIQGWPFFVPGYLPTTVINFHGLESDLEDRFIGQQLEFFFPVEFGMMASTRRFVAHTPGEGFAIGAFSIKTGRLANGAAAYRVQAGGRVLVLGQGCTLGGDCVEDGPLVDLCQGAHVLVAGFPIDPQAEARPWLLEIASKLGVDRLVVTNHNPAHVESELRAVGRRLSGEGGAEVSIAREGDELTV